ncbi:hypothetical protein GHO45_18580 [Pseudomonas sp. FSL R10-0765]|uniref:hypothetical protein n=1 Tax=Pseudomonas sp. FSL R10-0765 TaxID=2662195 RepID=UPI001294B456|nr:hypothetical protein [Pseudomonas sp. FSL R10-0765]MQT42930.1 hypothetical protein [Pseudomonas sp. FSL R10-0765]
MAVTAKLNAVYGEERETYVRIISLSANNHGELSVVLFRGFISREGFKSGASYFWEKELSMMLDVSAPLWSQAYSELKKLTEFSEAVDC